MRRGIGSTKGETCGQLPQPFGETSSTPDDDLLLGKLSCLCHNTHI